MNEAPVTRKLEDAIEAIPVFPLPHVALFPGVAMPLHIFEPRYRRMLQDCLATHGALAIAQLPYSQGDADPSGPPRMARIVGGGIVVHHQPLPDGRSNIILHGQARLRLEQIVPEEEPRYPYLRARATILVDADTNVPEGERAALVSAATMFAAEVRRHDPNFGFRVPAATTAGALADVCAFHLVVDATARQALLEELCPRARVRMVTSQLALQQGAMLDDKTKRVLN